MMRPSLAIAALFGAAAAYDGGFKRDKCQQFERDECCNLPDNLSYYRKETICNNLGCNIKKCSKRDDNNDGDDDPDESWNGDEQDDATESPTDAPTEEGDSRSGDAHDGDGIKKFKARLWFDKCKQAEREVCCDQDESRYSWDERNEVCDLLGCNLKKCSKRNNASSKIGWSGDDHDMWGSPTLEPTAEWSGDEWGSPTLEPTMESTMEPTMDPTEWRGDAWGKTPDPTRRPTRRPTWRRATRRPTKRPSRSPTRRPTKRPSERPTRRPTPHPTEWAGDDWGSPTDYPTQDPTEWGGDDWGSPTDYPTGDPTEWNGDAWAGDDWGSPTEYPTKHPARWNGDAWSGGGPSPGDGIVGDGDPGTCRDYERGLCCNLPANLSSYRKSVICNNLGCNPFLCGGMRSYGYGYGGGYGGSKPSHKYGGGRKDDAKKPKHKDSGKKHRDDYDRAPSGGYGGWYYRKPSSEPTSDPTSGPTNAPTEGGCVARSCETYTSDCAAEGTCDDPICGAITTDGTTRASDVGLCLKGETPCFRLPLCFDGTCPLGLPCIIDSCCSGPVCFPPPALCDAEEEGEFTGGLAPFDYPTAGRRRPPR